MIPNWKKVWQFYSTWVVAAILAAPAAWGAMPLELKANVPEVLMPYIAVIAFVGFVLARVKGQNK